MTILINYGDRMIESLVVRTAFLKRKLSTRCVLIGVIAFGTLWAWHCAFPTTLRAQDTLTVGDGGYTREQATRGARLYEEFKCAVCHGDHLEGGGPNGGAPSLTGDDSLAHFSTLADLFTNVAETMPSNDPGVMTPQQVTDVLALVAQGNGWPPGDGELAADVQALRQIRIAVP